MVSVKTNNPELLQVAERLDEKQKEILEGIKEAERKYQSETDSVCDILHHAKKNRQNPKLYRLETMAELCVKIPAETVPSVVEVVEKQRKHNDMIPFFLGVLVGVCASLLLTFIRW